MNEMLNKALEYRVKYNLSVIPCRRDKKPLIKWEEFQKRKAEPSEIEDWFAKDPDANIGIVTGDISNLSVIDIDTEEGKNNIIKYFPDKSLLMTPTALTPRKGKHIYFQCSDSKLSNNVGLIKGCDFRANGGYVIAPPSKSDIGQYSWLISFEHAIPKQISPEYLAYISNASYLKSSNSLSIEHVPISVPLFQNGRRDNDLFHIAHQLLKANTPVEEVRQTLKILAKSCNPPFPENEIDIKIESALKRQNKKDVNITEIVENYIMQTDGAFSNLDIYNGTIQGQERDTGGQNGISRDTIKKITQRLKSKGIISKFGDKDGWYIRVDDRAENIDFLNAPTDAIDLKYPFRIEQLFKTFSKNLIVIAGVPDAGKTAFLLNFVKLNMKKHEIHYFSSEMGPTELRDRLSKFDDVYLKDWKFYPKERSSDFASVIQPDAINVIDFMEMSDNFYKVAGYFLEIHKKLNKGIAIIALQKNPKSEVGRGGYFSTEKPRLYLNMEQGKLKIVKAKNWVNPMLKPAGLTIEFKIIQGCKFIITKEWYEG